jgi:uncharacterized protein YdaU (DUF1376 family)
MYYYQFHIGDYRADTAHLSNDEDLAYRRLLDMYYDLEKPIPTDTEWVSRRLRLDSQVVLRVLKDFFLLQDDGWFHGRCHEVIEQYHSMAEKNRENGRRGGRPKRTQSDTDGNQLETNSQPDGKATSNQEPITNNHKPLTTVERTRATRLPTDWQPTPEMIEFCANERPELQVKDVVNSFRDYWIAAPGAKGRKADWLATWRNWVRNQRAQQAAFKPYESAKDKSRRELAEKIFGSVKNEQQIIDIN